MWVCIIEYRKKKQDTYDYYRQWVTIGNAVRIIREEERVCCKVVHDIRAGFATVVVDPLYPESVRVGGVAPDSSLCIAGDTGGFSGLRSVIHICSLRLSNPGKRRLIMDKIQARLDDACEE